ncbi:MAG TPA: hypothetical protein VHT30_12870 [Acidimicrobiales bacterium]|jgi:hypothetical protein|nr:hypothetical protein [Acidimicrobiales bacterium]
MEVGEMVIALMCATVLLCACWAWRFQLAALRLLRGRPSHAPMAAGFSRSAVGTPTAANDDPTGAGAAASDDRAPTRVALRQLPATAPSPGATPSSVLGWEAFCIASTMVLDGTALIGCSWRPDPDPDVPITRAQRAWAMGTSEREIATFVLLLGEDERAAQAYDLLEVWRETESTLRLRPAPVAGAVEVYDGHHRALRACLLAA